MLGKTEAAYFKWLNDTKGGINGRKITFISRDDGYSPPKAVENVRSLVEGDEVALIFGVLGTPFPHPKIGILYRNDDFGKDLIAGLKDGLGPDADKMIVSVQGFQPTDPTIDSQIVIELQIARQRPNPSFRPVEAQTVNSLVRERAQGKFGEIILKAMEPSWRIAETVPKRSRSPMAARASTVRTALRPSLAELVLDGSHWSGQ